MVGDGEGGGRAVKVDHPTQIFLSEFFLKMRLLNSRESRLADPPLEDTKWYKSTFEQKRTTGGDRGQNLEKK